MITAYQALPILKAFKNTPDTLGMVLTRISNEGIYRGSFKGFTPALLQCCSVLYPSVWLARNEESFGKKISKFFSTYMILDTLLYPLDTMKNVVYSDLYGQLGINFVMQD